MSDLIVQLVAKRPHEKTAVGIVSGIEVRLEKTKYTTKVQDIEWKVAAFREDTGHTNQSAGLTAEEAEDLFMELTETHGLEEIQPDDGDHQ